MQTAAATLSPGASQNVVGVVRDSISGESLPFVNVYCKSSKSGVLTDDRGVFKINARPGQQIEVSSMGYGKSLVQVGANSDTLFVLLSPASVSLEEVVVKPKKQKYSKRNNPAVDLMRQVRADRDKHNPSTQEKYSYNRYDKMMLAINNYTGYSNASEKKKSNSLMMLVDTAAWTGARILDMSMKENVSTLISSDSGKSSKIVVRGRRSNGIDNALDENFSRVFFEDILRDVDIYANDIPVMKTRFVSPLAAIGADFYKYEITDTLQIGTDRCVELTFVPRNAESTGFNGKLYIPADDSVKYVKRVVMRMPKASNVNYVQNLILNQTFRRDSLGFTHKVIDDMVVELHVAGSFGELYASRQSRFDNFGNEIPGDLQRLVSATGDYIVLEDADSQTPEFWQQHRMIPLSYAESILALPESPFRKIPWINWLSRGVEIIVKGYVRTGEKSKFDFGGIDTFVSYDALEGLRLSVGGVTTANLNPHLFARGHLAWGVRDHKWKFNAELEYSFKKKKYHSREFPMNGIRASVRYDVHNIGQHFMTNTNNNLLNSFKRRQSELAVYEGLAKLEYNCEWNNHFSLSVAASAQRLYESPFVKFVDAEGTAHPHYTQSSLRVGLRYAPGEKFMQTYDTRISVNRDALVISLAHEFGPKSFLGSEYNLNLTEFFVQKRLWFSAFGHMDVLVKGAKLWGQVQFPALLWQNANLAYTIQRETYCLLNPMEFAVDQYASVDLQYNLNGLIFNRIPLLKKLRLREVVSFRGFLGNLSRKNNPEYNDNLFRFPTGSGMLMGHTPYMEMSAGFANILTFLRLEYVWRLSYRNTPGTDRHGIRFSFEFAF